ncbi:unnamed protein product [Meloidogyne enterolobii]|uniref:Uncharacterized protein n=1 Tax=Meloidogyne enterolobii TaxID=390850 RepID=A0ACB1AYD7_MELEN
MNSSSNSNKIKNAIPKIKSNRGGTRQSETSDTSSISTEDEFVCVKRPKMNEIGTMTSETKTFKVEENTGLLDVLFNFLNFIVELFKALFNKAKNVTFIRMDWISTIRHRLITKKTIVMVFDKLFLILFPSFFLLFFILICNVFWLAFSACIFEDLIFGRWWSAIAIFSLFSFVVALIGYFFMLHEFIMEVFY